MGTANAQRALDYIRTLAQFISQPEYSPVIQIYSFINEPNANAVGKSPVGSFYYEAYQIIRDITGIGEGNGAVLSMHDGFLGIQNWYGFLPGADRMALDQHSYMVNQLYLHEYNLLCTGRSSGTSSQAPSIPSQNCHVSIGAMPPT